MSRACLFRVLKVKRSVHFSITKYKYFHTTLQTTGPPMLDGDDQTLLPINSLNGSYGWKLTEIYSIQAAIIFSEFWKLICMCTSVTKYKYFRSNSRQYTSHASHSEIHPLILWSTQPIMTTKPVSSAFQPRFLFRTPGNSSTSVGAAIKTLNPLISSAFLLSSSMRRPTNCLLLYRVPVRGVPKWRFYHDWN